MRALVALAWVELKLFAREPLTVLFVLVLPVVVLYILNGVFGSAPPDPTVWEGLDAVTFYTPSYVALVAATSVSCPSRASSPGIASRACSGGSGPRPCPSRSSSGRTPWWPRRPR